MTPLSPERLEALIDPRYRTARRARPDPRLSSAATKHCPQLIFLRDEAYQGSHRCEGETACGWLDLQSNTRIADDVNRRHGPKTRLPNQAITAAYRRAALCVLRCRHQRLNAPTLLSRADEVIE